MRKMAIAVAVLTAALWAVPASAQLDPMSYGEASANLGRVQVMNNAINRQARSGSSALTTKQRAQATCANKGSLKAKYGADDARTKKLYSLCAQAGY
ncbi:hypothetical protein [Sphingobium sp. WCS2017Hpa-17]|uniref:hypothetical protein n=1 Tax=Sphingobium sp. WCS2017Hpa-17 TaxID=3073638 RepID=UPI00288C437D|nr:hypothetical protein [Sphingobium sp. WCS2017Hpa-17]